jgi:hypothetical protein
LGGSAGQKASDKVVPEAKMLAEVEVVEVAMLAMLVLEDMVLTLMSKRQGTKSVLRMQSIYEPYLRREERVVDVEAKEVLEVAKIL